MSELKESIKNSALEIIGELESELPKELEVSQLEIDGKNIAKNILGAESVLESTLDSSAESTLDSSQDSKRNAQNSGINALSEREFLELLEDKLLVLFSGLKSKNFADKEKRLNLVLSFLEYQLALINERLK